MQLSLLILIYMHALLHASRDIYSQEKHTDQAEDANEYHAEEWEVGRMVSPPRGKATPHSLSL